jgi:hypothetical protein
LDSVLTFEPPQIPSTVLIPLCALVILAVYLISGVKSRQVFTLIEFLAVSANDYDVCRIALRQQKAALYAFHERNG